MPRRAAAPRTVFLRARGAAADVDAADDAAAAAAAATATSSIAVRRLAGGPVDADRRGLDVGQKMVFRYGRRVVRTRHVLGGLLPVSVLLRGDGRRVRRLIVGNRVRDNFVPSHLTHTHTYIHVQPQVGERTSTRIVRTTHTYAYFCSYYIHVYIPNTHFVRLLFFRSFEIILVTTRLFGITTGLFATITVYTRGLKTRKHSGQRVFRAGDKDVGTGGWGGGQGRQLPSPGSL